MKAKPILLLYTLVGGFFGITVLLVPDMMSSLFGMPMLDAGLAMSRHEGAWVLGSAILAFLIRNEEHSNIRQMIFLFYIMAIALMVAIEIIQIILAIGNVLIWSLIGIHGFFLVLYLILFWENR